MSPQDEETTLPLDTPQNLGSQEPTEMLPTPAIKQEAAATTGKMDWGDILQPEGEVIQASANIAEASGEETKASFDWNDIVDQ